MIAAVASPPISDARVSSPKGKPPRDEHFAGAMKDASAPAESTDPKAPADPAADPADASAMIAPGASAAAPDVTALAAVQAMLAAIAGATIPAKSAPATPGAGATNAGAVASSPRPPLRAIPVKDAPAADRDGGDAPADATATPAASFSDAQRAVAALADDANANAVSPPAAGASAAAPAEAMVAHHLDLAKDAAWLDRLAQDIARSADAGGHLRFTLAPEHLGKLEVQLSAAADGTAIRLTTETREAHRIVADAQPRLIAEARAQGLRVSDTQVDLDQRQSGQSQAFGNQNSGGGGQPQRQAAWPRPSVTAPAAATAAAGDDDLYA